MKRWCKWIKVSHETRYAGADVEDAKKAYILDWKERVFTIADVTAELVEPVPSEGGE